MAEMERLCEVAKVDMHWYEGAFEDVEEYREIKLMIRRCLASTAMPDAGEIVRQIRSSICVLQGIDVFFETDSIMTLLRDEHGPDKIKDVALCLGREDYR